MARSKIVWTILPYGTVDGTPDGRQRVSVVVSPRLTPETPKESMLEAFPEFVKWPSEVGDASFSVEANGEIIPLSLVSEIDKSLWNELFSEKTPVEGFKYRDLSRTRIRSYPIRNVLAYLKENYSKLAVESPRELPDLLPEDGDRSALRDMLEDAGTKFPEKLGPEEEKLNAGKEPKEDPGFSRFFDGDFEEPPDYDPGVFRTKTEYDLYQADRFYRREKREPHKRRPDFRNIPKRLKAPKFDFHRSVAALADYPELMRRLGLVLDFVLETPITATIGYMRLCVKLSSGADINETPWTAFLIDDYHFLTRPRTDELKSGLLNLRGSNDKYGDSAVLYDMYQVDPDGAAIKTVDFVVNAQGLVAGAGRNRIAAGIVSKQGVAALRSGGLGVSRHERAKSLVNDIATMTENNSNLEGNRSGGIVLYAEDVLRGYRVDIEDKRRPGVWRSLCARVGEYKLTKTGEAIDSVPEDEGYVYGASTTSQEGSDDQYLHESLFRWTGWSLCAPRPGLTLESGQVDEKDGGNIQSETPSKITEQAEDGCGVKADFKAPKGSLPRLRFGRSYRCRARIVDIAGNSLSVDDPKLDDSCASDAVGYWRFEPIDPPVIAHRARVSEGESLERMVIRSNCDVSSKDYSAWLRGDSPLSRTPSPRIHSLPSLTRMPSPPRSPDFDYGEVNERHFVPPKSSQQQCETHGLFDPNFGDWEQIKKGYAIAAALESGSLNDGLPEREKDMRGSQIKLITPASLDGIATTAGLKPGQPSAENPVGDRMAGGQYVIHGEAQIDTPWLPDAAAGGTAIRAAMGSLGLPGVTRGTRLDDPCEIVWSERGEPTILIHNEGIWPKTKGFRLILAEREAVVDASACNENFVDNGEPIWDKHERTLTIFVPKGRIIRLVYSSFADKEYIESFGIPQWVEDEAGRNKVYQSALCGANWLITPYRELTLVHATQKPLFMPRFTSLALDRGELGSHDVKLSDAKAGGITLHGPSTGKFEIEAEWSEWVDDPAKNAPERVQFKGQLGEIKLAENHANRLDLETAVNNQLHNPADKDAQRGDVHALGDTRFRLIQYRIRATTRFSEYLPPSICEDADAVTQLGHVATSGDMLPTPPQDDAGAPIIRGAASSLGSQTFVPSSAQPADPRVMYVMPTMRWETDKNATVHDVTRYGNGLRVWLDRPWFTSGDGELLGVVIYDGVFKKMPPELEPFVTQWGRDPFWNSSSPPKAEATADDFRAAATSEPLSLHEVPGSKTKIVGHRVHWSDKRKMWHCDIELDPIKAYMPFVRLALVRYQPNALPGAKISKVVLTDFAQVLPRRRATVRVAGDTFTAALYGPNPTDPGAASVASDKGKSELHNKGRNRVELVLQTRDKSFSSDLDWKDANRLIDKPANGIGEEPFWQATVQSPKWKTEYGNQSCRLMLREFERFYVNATDIEERLVFADIIELA